MDVEPGKNGNIEVVEPPRGTFQGRLDEKGRLKLPVSFQEYLKKLPEPKLFATKLDDDITRVYPIHVWREIEKSLDTGEIPGAEKVLFVAYHLGGDTEMDGQGRILIPPELRRAVGIENQPVKLMFLRGVLQVFSEAMYQEYLQTALAGQTENVAALKLTKGLK